MSLNTLLDGYKSAPEIWDEMHDGERIRHEYEQIVSALQALNTASLQQKEKLASELFIELASAGKQRDTIGT